MDEAEERHEARQPRQQAEVHDHRGRHRPGRRLRGVVLRRAGLQRQELLLPGHARAAPTPSPRRAASTPPRTTRTTATRVWRLFYDTIKGGDFRAREANVYRLAEVSNNIIDQCVAQGVPFAREYGGTLANRSFGGAQVSRTFYARGQTGQQLLIGAYQSLMRQVELGKVTMFPRTEMLDLVVIDGRARGIVTRNLVTGEDRVATCGDAVVLATGGYGNVFYLSTNAKGSQRHRHLAGPPQGRVLRQPLLHPDPPDLHPARRRLPVEAHADVRVAAQRRPHLGAQEAGRQAGPRPDPRGRARLLPGAQVPDLRQPGSRATSPRAPPSRSATTAAASARAGCGVYLDFSDSIKRLGANAIAERYGNLFEMYERITGEDPYHGADAHLPGGALHHGRPVGGLQPA